MISQFFRQNTFASIIPKIVFVSMVIILTILNIFGSFRGMNSNEAMEAASLGREIARGNGLNNKIIYPVAIKRSLDKNQPLLLTDNKNTSTAPGHAYLNAIILGSIGAQDFDTYRVTSGNHVYTPDRVLALASMLFLMCSIGFSYQLTKNLFDIKIAKTVAVLMLLSGSMWQFVQSCLPQMFLLMLFSMALYFFHKALVIFDRDKSIPWFQITLCAILFGLMAITKWLTLWIFLGYLAAVLVRFKPKGLIALVSLVIVGLFITPALIFNYTQHGNILGAAGFTLVNSLADSEESMLRNFGPLPVRVNGMVLSITKTVLLQISDIVRLTGGMIVAPLFFLTLLHPYKRDTTNQFKFSLALMWFPAVIGMAIFGGRSLELAHQLHILFVPAMIAFGISVVALLWARLPVASSKGALHNVHLFVIVILCSGPLLTDIPKQVKETFESKGKGKPNAPFYQTAELTNELHDLVLSAKTSTTPVIFSDQPAATAWYADVHSIALPKSATQIKEIDQFANTQSIEISGIHTSAISTRHIYDNAQYFGVMPLVNLPLLQSITGIPLHPQMKTLASSGKSGKRSPWQNIAQSYPHTSNILSSNRTEGKDYGHHVFHSRKAVENK